MEIVTDKSVKHELWEKWGSFLERHFPNGGENDPEYCIIHFIANETTTYIDGKTETFCL